MQTTTRTECAESEGDRKSESGGWEIYREATLFVLLTKDALSFKPGAV